MGCAQAASKAQAAAAVSAGLVIFPISGSRQSGAGRPAERSEPFFTTEVAGPGRSVQQNGGDPSSVWPLAGPGQLSSLPNRAGEE